MNNQESITASLQGLATMCKTLLENSVSNNFGFFNNKGCNENSDCNNKMQI